MDSLIPDGLAPRPHPNAHTPRTKKSRLRVKCAGATIDLLDISDHGFSTSASEPELQRGYVEICDGTKVLSYGLAYRVEDVDGQRHYRFKRRRQADLAPPVDFAWSGPTGYIGRTD